MSGIEYGPVMERWTPQGMQMGREVVVGQVRWFIPESGSEPVRLTPKPRTFDDAWSSGLRIGLIVGATVGMAVIALLHG